MQGTQPRTAPGLRQARNFVGWAKAPLRRAHQCPEHHARWWARGVYHRARISRDPLALPTHRSCRRLSRKGGPAVRCLPFLAVDLSSKQKHPANNAGSARLARNSEAAAKILRNRMMSAANTPIIWLVRLQNRLFGRSGAGRPQGLNILTQEGPLPIRPPFLKGSRFQPPPRLQGLRDAGDKRISRCRGAAN
jgi:hypothetical protein